MDPPYRWARDFNPRKGVYCENNNLGSAYQKFLIQLHGSWVSRGSALATLKYFHRRGGLQRGKGKIVNTERIQDQIHLLLLLFFSLLLCSGPSQSFFSFDKTGASLHNDQNMGTKTARLRMSMLNGIDYLFFTIIFITLLHEDYIDYLSTGDLA